MFFVCDLSPVSQAECRRFDPGLPLQTINCFSIQDCSRAPRFTSQIKINALYLALVDDIGSSG
jgi:hypothetical protein